MNPEYIILQIFNFLIIKVPILNTIFSILGLIVTIGQLIVFLTPTKKDDNLWGKLIDSKLGLFFKTLISFAPFQKRHANAFYPKIVHQNIVEEKKVDHYYYYDDGSYKYKTKDKGWVLKKGEVFLLEKHRKGKVLWCRSIKNGFQFITLRQGFVTRKIRKT
jgi:hypothetical protein